MSSLDSDAVGRVLCYRILSLVFVLDLLLVFLHLLRVLSTHRIEVTKFFGCDDFDCVIKTVS
jgi:hypothetical protein